MCQTVPDLLALFPPAKVRLLVECEAPSRGQDVREQMCSRPITRGVPTLPGIFLVPLVLRPWYGGCTRYCVVLIMQLELKLSLLEETMHHPCIESAALASAAVAVASKQELEKPYCQSTNLGGRERHITRRFSVAWRLVG